MKAHTDKELSSSDGLGSLDNTLSKRKPPSKCFTSRTASTPFFPHYYSVLRKSSLHKINERHGRRRPSLLLLRVARKTNSLTPDGSTITSANASPRTHRIRATCSRLTRRTPKTRASRTRTWRRWQKRAVVFSARRSSVPRTGAKENPGSTFGFARAQTEAARGRTRRCRCTD